MIQTSQGNGYIGSSTVIVSVAGVEVLPSPPANFTHPYSCYKLTFINQDACTVQINNDTSIYLLAYQGFQIDKGDLPIFSLRILENNIRYTYMGCI